jgi:hypothetical protein
MLTLVYHVKGTIYVPEDHGEMDCERLCFYHRQKKLVDSAGKKLTHLLI